jgi:hypothetical protein
VFLFAALVGLLAQIELFLPLCKGWAKASSEMVFFLSVDQVDIKFNKLFELIGVVEVNARHRLNRWDGALVGIPGLHVMI